MLERRIYVPKVGDGNPFCAQGIANLIDGQIHELNGMSSLVSWWHQVMTLWGADSYTKNSESLRQNTLAKLASTVLSFEWQQSIPHQPTDRIGLFVQEHPLMSVSKEKLHHDFSCGVYLVVPDVYPKQSAIEVAKQKEATMLVWNQDAYDLVTHKYQYSQVELVRPMLMSSILGSSEDYYCRGSSVVVKSSGSGMPSLWLRELQSTLFTTNLDVRIFSKSKLTTNHQTIHLPSDSQLRAAMYFHELGELTQLIVSYPSEQIQIITEMFQLGWK